MSERLATSSYHPQSAEISIPGALTKAFKNEPLYLIDPDVKIPQKIEIATNLIFNRDLKEAGFDSEMELSRLLRDINTALASGKSLDEAIGVSIGELKVNFRSYSDEIIKQRPFLVHLNRFGEWQGQERMVGNNGYPVVDSITAQERKGSVLQASKLIETFLFSTPNNSYAVLMNPAGWNGFVDEDGKELAHLNTEIMIFWKDQKGNLKGGTLVVDLAENHARETMVSLGVAREVLGGKDEKERLANIVRNPALLAFPRSDITPFEYALDQMLSVRGNGDFRLLQQDGTVEIRSVEEIRRDIRRFDQLFALTYQEEFYINQPGQFILEEKDRLKGKDIQQKIVYKIEEAVLMLTRTHLKERAVISHAAVLPLSRGIQFAEATKPFPYREDSFAPELAFLKTRAGCPPHRLGSGRVLRGVSLGFSLGSRFSSEIGQFGMCEECGGSSGDNHYHCPNCPREYADETNVAPENRTKQCKCGFKFGC